ncbi:DUF1850 domain-containing protein [Insolitispirillum peregrinum]|nr:DUF1850 domain-containing protein [Insolitispirillum peregrinum]
MSLLGWKNTLGVRAGGVIAYTAASSPCPPTAGTIPTMSSSLAIALCISLLGGKGAAPLPSETATLHWDHKAEAVQREERWSLSPQGLSKTLSRVKAADPAMTFIPPDARREGEWYVQTPQDPPIAQLVLPASDHVATATLCSGKRCAPLRSWLTRAGQGKNAEAPKPAKGEPIRRSTLLPVVLYPCSRQ